MPALYLFDTEDARWRRPWARMLPAGCLEVRIEADAFRHDGGEARDGVVVAHASRLPDDAARERLCEGARAAGLSLVIISGGAPERRPLAAHVYRRLRPVRTRDFDEEFAHCFARFWEHHLRTGEIRFALLEPERDVLTALHVLCRGAVLAHDAARPEDAAWAAAVPLPAWWSLLEVAAARLALEEKGVRDARLDRLLDLVAAGRPVPAETARQALAALPAGV